MIQQALVKYHEMKNPSTQTRQTFLIWSADNKHKTPTNLKN